MVIWRTNPKLNNRRELKGYVQDTGRKRSVRILGKPCNTKSAKLNKRKVFLRPVKIHTPMKLYQI
jgi:hypothetical protein